ncbi:excalibur calcium-binding domain-containing protein [Marisediminicola sp. LYQ85]|uniref:excalibur calcium-binding domain-containing protein n=1 Tax=Marisediminicola sp. LYQ85 TaxID=3391062 RepID=UPI00398363C1
MKLLVILALLPALALSTLSAPPALLQSSTVRAASGVELIAGASHAATAVAKPTKRPTARFAYKCNRSKGLIVAVTNPNRSAIKVAISHSRKSGSSTISVPARGTARFENRVKLPEDKRTKVSVSFRGKVVASKTFSVNCVKPAPAVKPKPKPKPSAVYYKNCDAVRAAGKAPLHKGQPGYEAPRLDRDRDGVACER